MRISCGKVKRVSSIIDHTAKAHEMRCFTSLAKWKNSSHSFRQSSAWWLLSRLIQKEMAWQDWIKLIMHKLQHTKMRGYQTLDKIPLSPHCPLASVFHFHSGAHPLDYTHAHAYTRYLRRIRGFTEERWNTHSPAVSTWKSRHMRAADTCPRSAARRTVRPSRDAAWCLRPFVLSCPVRRVLRGCWDRLNRTGQGYNAFKAL